MSPIVMPNGGGDDIGTGELIAYNATQNTPQGEQTATEQAVSAELEAKAEALAATWGPDSPRPSPSVDPLEVLARAAQAQGQLTAAVRQWARPGTERRMLEMIGSLLTEITTRDRELLELRARLDASPY